jgi:thioredoxin reductase
MQQANRSYVIIERAGEPGAFFRTYPRHRQLISINKRYTGHEEDLPKRNPEFNLRHDWNSLVNDEESGGKGLLFTDYSKEFYPPASTMLTYLRDFARLYDLRIRYHEEVYDIMRSSDAGEQCRANISDDDDSREGFPFAMKTRKLRDGATAADAVISSYSCGNVIIATGISVPYVPNFTGNEHIEGYDTMDIDPENFLGKSILILGNGNSAFETASNLINGANYIHMASRSAARLTIATHYVGDVRLTAQVGAVIEGYQLKSLVGFAEKDYERLEEVIYFEKDAKTGRIRLQMFDNSSRSVNNGAVYPLDRAYDHVFRCTGWGFDSSLFTADSVPAMMKKAVLNGKPLRVERCTTVQRSPTKSSGPNCLAPADDTEAAGSYARARALKELRGLKISELKTRARAAGVGQSALDEADDVAEPKTAVAELVITAEADDDVQRSRKYPELTGWYESTNVDGMYFAGTLAHGLDWRRAAGGFIHGFRYTAQALFRVLSKANHGVEWPSRRMPFQPADLIKQVSERINTASGMYQMFGELVDVIQFPSASDGLGEACSGGPYCPGRSQKLIYYYSVPVGYIEQLVPADSAYMTISFEYGPKDEGLKRPSSGAPGRDVFRELRTPFSAENAGWLGVSELIHPVARLSAPARGG